MSYSCGWLSYVDAGCYRILADQHTPSLRGAKRRSNPDCLRGKILDCFAALAMTMWREHRPHHAFDFSCARSSSTSTRTFSE
ncbi:hypothetical protein CT676_20740 [Bradyrhizobium sp. MOS001]|nr:hypothetical protein CT676_20740 [Bradyrhizobium sp. MOS001]